MERSLSNNKWRFVYRGGIIACLAILFALLAVWCGINIFINKKVSTLPIAVQPAARELLYGYLLDDTGQYLESGLLEPAKSISKLPLSDRLEFYKFVIINCDMHSASEVTFFEVVDKDDKQLRSNLVEFKATPQYADLAEEQRKRVDVWIESLK